MIFWLMNNFLIARFSIFLCQQGKKHFIYNVSNSIYFASRRLVLYINLWMNLVLLFCLRKSVRFSLIFLPKSTDDFEFGFVKKISSANHLKETFWLKYCSLKSFASIQLWKWQFQFAFVKSFSLHVKQSLRKHKH